MKKIVLDCETQKKFSDILDGRRTWDLLLSTAVTYCFDDDEYRFWTVLNKNNLMEYLNGNYIIGYNSLTFDCPLLMGETHQYDENGNSSNSKYAWQNYDIYIEIKKRLLKTKDKPIKETFEALKKSFKLSDRGVYTLKSVAIATLNRLNYKDYGDSTELFKQKKILDLVESNLQNTRIVKQLYQFVQKYRYIINGNYDIIKF